MIGKCEQQEQTRKKENKKEYLKKFPTMGIDKCRMELNHDNPSKIILKNHSNILKSFQIMPFNLHRSFCTCNFPNDFGISENSIKSHLMTT